MNRINAVKGRVLGTALAAILAPAAAFTVTALGSADAEAAVDKAACRVHVVEAKTEGDGTVPKNLKFLEEELQGLMAFKSFELVASKDLKLETGKPGTLKFPRHELKLQLLGGDKKLKLRATILGASGKSLVGANYSIADDGVVMLPVVKKDKSGATVYAIQCHSKRT